MKQLIAILAAGESRRMGTPKLCLAWGKTTILGHVRAEWLEAGAEKIVVVHAPGDSAVLRELDHLGVAPENRTPTLAMERGMMGSVVTAATRAIEDPSLTHLIISLGDQPQIQSSTMKKLLRTCVISPGEIVRVVHNGKPGHPLALPAAILLELSTTPAETLRDFLRLKDMPVCDLTIADSGVLLDLDTPADYARATSPLPGPDRLL